MHSPIKRDIIPVLGALCLFLSIIEYVIPKPIPFIKLGLANLPIILSLFLLKPKDSLKLILIKSVGGSLVTGTLFSWIFLYSLSGSLVSGIIMILTYRALGRWVSMIGVSVLGALSSNIVQISVATLFLGEGAKYIGIPILISGLVSGFLIGLFSNKFISKSRWIESVKEY